MRTNSSLLVLYLTGACACTTPSSTTSNELVGTPDAVDLYFDEYNEMPGLPIEADYVFAFDTEADRCMTIVDESYGNLDDSIYFGAQQCMDSFLALPPGFSPNGDGGWFKMIRPNGEVFYQYIKGTPQNPTSAWASPTLPPGAQTVGEIQLIEPVSGTSGVWKLRIVGGAGLLFTAIVVATYAAPDESAFEDNYWARKRGVSKVYKLR
jgi:hypothetical protein